MTAFIDREPVIPTLCAAPPFTDRCSRCNAPAPVEPVHQFERGCQVRSVYQCPSCGSSWWTCRELAAYVGDSCADGEVAA